MSRSAERIAEMTRLADMMAWNFLARRHWLDRAELVQEAWLVLLELELEFDENCGVPFGAFLWRYGVRKLHARLVHSNAPVSASKDWLKELMASRGQPVGGDRMSGEIDLPTPEPGADQIAHMRRRQKAVHEAINGVYNGDLAMRVLIGEAKPAEVARELGLNVWDVYRANCAAREAVKASKDVEKVKDHWD